MTRDDILRMAKEAGFTVRKWDDGLDEVMDGDNYHIQTDQVIDLVNLVAAETKLECIDLLMKLHEKAGDRHNYFAYAAMALRGEK